MASRSATPAVNNLCSHSTSVATAKLKHTHSFFFFPLPIIFYHANVCLKGYEANATATKINVNYNFDHFFENVLLKCHPRSSPLSGAGAPELTSSETSAFCWLKCNTRMCFHEMSVHGYRFRDVSNSDVEKQNSVDKRA